MAFNGNISPGAVTSNLNGLNVDVKRGLRLNQQEINNILVELADPNQDLVIDGHRFSGSDKFSTAATLIVNNKMEELSNQSTTMISVFQTLFTMEKQVGGLS